MYRVDHQYVRGLLDRGYSDEMISQDLRRHYPAINQGLSAESVRKWRLSQGVLRRETVSDSEVDTNVRWAVGQLGVRSGRRFVKGYLDSTAGRPTIGENRIGKTLRENYPIEHSARREAATASFNPVPYHAEYFGHKMHADQNEKLARFGITHVAAIDGYSGFIVGYGTMPVKNNVLIYDKIFREPVLSYGLWDQIVVDHGKEFHLVLSYQDYLKGHRFNQTRAPYLQIKSTKVTNLFSFI